MDFSGVNVQSFISSMEDLQLVLRENNGEQNLVDSNILPVTVVEFTLSSLHLSSPTNFSGVILEDTRNSNKLLLRSCTSSLPRLEREPETRCDAHRSSVQI